MKILAIDTAHRKNYVATSSGIVGDEVEAVLREADWSPKDLDLVGVGAGPGSFTGVRRGVALAKGLNLATGVPLLPYVSLAAYWTEGIWSLFDARAGGVYAYDGKEPAQFSLEEAAGLGRCCSVDAEVLRERGLEVEEAKLQLEALFEGLEAGAAGASGDGNVPIWYLRRGRA